MWNGKAKGRVLVAGSLTIETFHQEICSSSHQCSKVLYLSMSKGINSVERWRQRYGGLLWSSSQYFGLSLNKQKRKGKLLSLFDVRKQKYLSKNSGKRTLGTEKLVVKALVTRV